MANIPTIYLDRRNLVTGRNSILHLHNFLDLNAHIDSIINTTLAALGIPDDDWVDGPSAVYNITKPIAIGTATPTLTNSLTVVGNQVQDYEYTTGYTNFLHSGEGIAYPVYQPTDVGTAGGVFQSQNYAWFGAAEKAGGIYEADVRVRKNHAVSGYEYTHLGLTKDGATLNFKSTVIGLADDTAFTLEKGAVTLEIDVASGAGKKFVFDADGGMEMQNDLGTKIYRFPAVDGTNLEVLTTNGAGDLYWGAAPVIIENMVYVSENGSDATGLRERLDRPFLTIQAAMTAAVAEDTVHVFPGVYTVPTGEQLIKPFVNLYLNSGTAVQLADIDASTFEIGYAVGPTGRGQTYGIYGKGDIIIVSTAGIVTVTPTVTSLAKFVLECNSLTVTDTNILWINFQELEINYITSYNINSSILDFDGTGAGGSKIIFNANTIRVKDTAGSQLRNIRVSNLTSNSTINIKIKWADIPELPIGQGFINCVTNDETCLIVVHVAHMRAEGGAPFANQLEPLIWNHDCSAKKDMTFEYVSWPGKIMSVDRTAAPVVLELGTIRVRGVVVNTDASVIMPDMIDLMKVNQQLIFELDIEDRSTHLFQTTRAKQSLLNISSTDGLQVIKGQIKTVRADATDSLIKYGETQDSATVVNLTATLEDLTIVGAGGYSIEKLNAVTTANVPCKGVYSNIVGAPANGGITDVLDSLQVDATDVR